MIVLIVRKSLLPGLFFMSTSTLASAAGEGASPIMSTISSLVLVLIAIAVVAIVARKVLPAPGARAGLLRVVDQLVIGQRERVSVVEFEGQWIVLGVTASQITVLAQSPSREIPAIQPKAVEFSRLLSRFRATRNED